MTRLRIIASTSSRKPSLARLVGRCQSRPFHLALGSTARTEAIKAGLPPKYLGTLGREAGDQKMFKRLPQADQIAILDWATKEERERYWRCTSLKTKIQWNRDHPQQMSQWKWADTARARLGWDVRIAPTRWRMHIAKCRNRAERFKGVRPMELTRPKSWTERLDELTARDAQHKAADPWKLRLERVKGKIDFSGRLERVTTQQLFDLLEIPQAGRTSGACRRLSAIMTELGWFPTMARGMTSGRDRARGYSRDPHH
jgi:hypothetical protein